MGGQGSAERILGLGLDTIARYSYSGSMATAALYLRVDPELDKALRQEAERRNVTLTALCTELLSKVAKAKR